MIYIDLLKLTFVLFRYHKSQSMMSIFLRAIRQSYVDSPVYYIVQFPFYSYRRFDWCRQILSLNKTGFVLIHHRHMISSMVTKATTIFQVQLLKILQSIFDKNPSQSDDEILFILMSFNPCELVSKYCVRIYGYHLVFGHFEMSYFWCYQT